MTEWKGEKITPENMDRIAKEIDEEWEKIKEESKKKPDWMIDENSTYGEVLEFEAITMPFKWKQVIEVEERAANSCREMAQILKDPKDKTWWLKSADDHEAHANEMRLKLGRVRKTAERAQRELDEVL